MRFAHHLLAAELSRKVLLKNAAVIGGVRKACVGWDKQIELVVMGGGGGTIGGGCGIIGGIQEIEN